IVNPGVAAIALLGCATEQGGTDERQEFLAGIASRPSKSCLGSSRPSFDARMHASNSCIYRWAAEPLTWKAPEPYSRARSTFAQQTQSEDNAKRRNDVDESHATSMQTALQYGSVRLHRVNVHRD